MRNNVSQNETHEAGATVNDTNISGVQGSGALRADADTSRANVADGRVTDSTTADRDASDAHRQKGPRREYLVQSLERGLRVLRCFTPATPTLSLQEIADQLKIPKGSAFRMVATLEALGYLKQDPYTKRYRVDIGVLDLGFACLSGMGYPDVALPYLERLANETRESSSMAVLDDLDIVYIARASIKRVMSINLAVGSRLPAFSTSMGKVLLAYLDDEVLDERLSRLEVEHHTPHTITDTEALREHLMEVRASGYALNDEELEIGLRSVAAPVRDGTGAVVAAINVSMVAARHSRSAIEQEIVPRLLQCAADISTGLGYRGRLLGSR